MAQHYAAEDILGNRFRITVAPNGFVLAKNGFGVQVHVGNFSNAKTGGARERGEHVIRAARLGVEELNKASNLTWRETL